MLGIFIIGCICGFLFGLFVVAVVLTVLNPKDSRNVSDAEWQEFIKATGGKAADDRRGSKKNN